MLSVISQQKSVTGVEANSAVGNKLSGCETRVECQNDADTAQKSVNSCGYSNGVTRVGQSPVDFETESEQTEFSTHTALGREADTVTGEFAF